MIASKRPARYVAREEDEVRRASGVDAAVWRRGSRISSLGRDGDMGGEKGGSYAGSEGTAVDQSKVSADFDFGKKAIAEV